ncbi:MAG TPA: cation diffusion facilitator family transporter [Leptospiraceae bacterium]|nr:cation diffusion facilitator family transporter [Leptospirales bacterium]HMW60158.1 cation diffusion facilitator family transporter [Leptospiraceae bacterium]HMX55048.1 cation diffusion facilitator family transporter [Leptospiraceae bacterium]HMY44430.1 cation diffusion facilitator family transporter [Leptospiraceae bacterium]HMZ35496.1 cation diffusion facilitator family transporter [Leptospiraceae bacterium]
MRTAAEQQATYRLRLRASVVSIVVGFLVCLLKFAGFLTTGSYAILSDALESIINVAAASFAAYCIVQGARKADFDHPYGRGRLEYFSASLEGALILLAGVIILNESIPKLFAGNVVGRMDLGLMFTGVGTVANGILAAFLIRSGKKHHSMALEADGHHVWSDVVSSIGLFVGLVLVAISKLPWLDPLLACIMALWILWSGFRILRQSFFQLMDRASPDVVTKVTSAIAELRKPEMIHPHRMRLRESGPYVLVDFHMIVPRFFTVRQLHDLEEHIHRNLESILDRPVDLMLHNDPCTSNNCGYCSMKNCRVRKKKQTSQLKLDPQHLLEDISHPVHTRDRRGD